MSGSGDTPVPQGKPLPDTLDLVDEIRGLIDETRGAVAAAVNAALTRLYWRVGRRIHEEIFKQGRAEYGKKILPTLSAKLLNEYGRGWSERNLAYMIRFAEVLPDFQILQALCAKLSWSHFRQIIYIEDTMKRDFYMEMCRIEGWSTRTLSKKIGSMLYERTALSRKPEELARIELEALRDEDRMSPDLVFRDPYVLDFLGLKDTYQEKDLEAAILSNIESFLMELGAGFSFLARQKRISLEEIRADILALEQETEGLLGDILGVHQQ